MASLALCFLGDFQARLASGRLLTISGRKVQALLACLAMSPGNGLTREKLAGILWSGRDDEHARNSLRQALTALRRDLVAIDPCPLIAGHDRLALEKTAVDVDVLAFERLAASGRSEDLQKAAALYRGDFLDGLHVSDPVFEQWLSGERERLRMLAAGVLERLVSCQSDAAAVATAQRLLSLDPLREASHRIAMQTYVAQGETDLALRQYENCREALHRELAVEPDAETESLAREIRAGRSAPGRLIHATPFVKTAAKSGPSDLLQKPVVALLPFQNMSDDPEQAHLSECITEDLISELSRFHSLCVIARAAALQYRDGVVGVKRVGRDLGVRYVVEGSIRRLGSRIRIAVQLVDAATGNHLWGERNDREVQSVFTVHVVIGMIAARTAAQIEWAEIDRARHKPDESLVAHDYLMRGLELANRSGADDVEPARLMFQRAIAADPNFARAHAAFAFACTDVHWGGAYEDNLSEIWLDRALEAATRAVVLDGNDSQCHRALAHVHVCQRSFELARHHLDLAATLNPNDAKVAATRSWLEVCAGRPDAVLASLDQAEKLSSQPPNWIWGNRGAVMYRLRRYADAMASFERMTATPAWVDRYRAACLAQLGRSADASARAAEALRREPRFTLRRYIMVEPYKLQSDLDHLLDGMRKAGLPE